MHIFTFCGTQWADDELRRDENNSDPVPQTFIIRSGQSNTKTGIILFNEHEFINSEFDSIDIKSSNYSLFFGSVEKDTHVDVDILNNNMIRNTDWLQIIRILSWPLTLTDTRMADLW